MGLGRLQWWLQGHPTDAQPYAVDRGPLATWLGNRVSDLRYWTWRAYVPLERYRELEAELRAAQERERALRESAQAVVDEHLKIYGAMGSFSKMGQLSEALAARLAGH